MEPLDRPGAEGGPDGRRAFLRSFLAAAGGLLAGCAGDGGDASTAAPESTRTAGGTRTESPAETSTATPSTGSRTEILDNEGPYTAAFYYPWWGPDRHWGDGYVSTPTLGEYDCREAETVSQHLAWANAYDIDSLYCSWWGPDSWEDETISEHLLPAAESAGVDVAILYEAPGRLDGEGSIDLSAEENRATLAEDFASLERFFESRRYATIGGRMPVFLYLTRILEGDVTGALEEAREAVDHDLFLVGDQVYWQDPETDQSQAVLDAVDAVSAYNMHTATADIDEGFVSDAIDQYEVWETALADRSVAFVPDVIPGFDDTAVRPEAGNPVIERTPDRFREFVEGVGPLRDDDLEMLFVTSFNEWHEDTQVEPAEEYGTDYLAALQEGLGTY